MSCSEPIAVNLNLGGSLSSSASSTHLRWVGRNEGRGGKPLEDESMIDRRRLEVTGPRQLIMLTSGVRSPQGLVNFGTSSGLKAGDALQCDGWG